MRDTARTLAALAGLTATLPVDLAITAWALARGGRPHRVSAERPRTVLVSGGKMTKALALCRAFHAAGHRVVLVETAKYRLTGHRFSRAVDAFHVVPSPTDPGYAQALLDVVRDEGVDVYVPVCSPVASRYDALAAETLAGHCEVVHGDLATVDMLDDKYAFTTTATAQGLSAPAAYRITDAEQLSGFDFPTDEQPFVLKNIAYDPVNRLDLTPLPRPTREQTTAFAASKPISPDNPWVLQSFVRGTEYCTHSTVRDGRVVVHVCCESSAFQVNYEHVDRPEIEKWVHAFVEPLGVTGQVSFDFIVDGAGRVLAIECNPRTHSAITLFHHRGAELAQAYLGERPDDAPPLVPGPDARPTYWTYHELWRALRHPSTARQRWRVVRAGRDAVFDPADPLPYLLLHHLQIPSLLLRNLVRGKPWTRIDFNIGKLVEPGGD
ncbi:hypothetical protein GCM10027265_45230 [Jatrophihabitans fulvus]